MKKRNTDLFNEWLSYIELKTLQKLLEGKSNKKTRKKASRKRALKEDIGTTARNLAVGTGAAVGAGLSALGIYKLYRGVSRLLMKIYDRGTRKEIMKQIDKALAEGDVEKVEKLKKYLDMYESGQINRERLTALIGMLFTAPAVLGGTTLGGLMGANVTAKLLDKLSKK